MAWLVLTLFCGTAAVASAQVSPADDVPDPGVEDSTEVETFIEGDDVDFEGKRIASYRFRCDLQLCQDPARAERFKDISGLAEGDIYTDRRLLRTQNRLAKTGFFQELTLERRLEDDGVHIEIDARGAVLIRRVRFEGLKPPPFESELRKVLMFRSGQVFREDEDQVRAQLSSLEALFEQEGYFGSTIMLEPRPVNDDRHLVDLVFTVERGEDRRICSLAFRGVRAMTTAEARELMFTGVSIIGRRIPLRLPMFTTAQFRNGRDALIGEYRERGYFRARVVEQAVQIDGTTNCVQLIVDVNEGPYWGIEFEGNHEIGDDQLRSHLPFATSGYVDDNEIRAAENAVRKVYESLGHPFSQVTGREEVADRLDRKLIFTIDEGPAVQIEGIRFEGVEVFSNQEATRGFGTQPFGLFESGGFLQTEQLLADFSHLERRYRQQGYMQAVVKGFDVEISERGDGMTIVVDVEEGPQSLIEGVDIDGQEIVSEEVLRALLELGGGDPFEPLNIRADQSRLSQHYGSVGHPRATVSTNCRRPSGEEVDCNAPRLPEQCQRVSFEQLVEEGCNWQGSQTWTCERTLRDDLCQFEDGVLDETIRVEHIVDEGPRVWVGEILLKGNFRTRSGVIFRELALETGDVMDVQKLIEGQGNMRSLGLFDSVSIETIGLDDDPDELDEQVASLIVSVEESRSRYLDFRFGVEGREAFSESRRILATGEMQYTDNNLLGAGQRFRPRLIGALDTVHLYRFGGSTGEDPESSGNISDIDYLVGAELIYNHPRFLKGQLGVDQLFLTVTPFYLLDLVGVSNDQVLSEEWGLRLEVRKELFEVMERFFLTLGVEAKQAATWSAGDRRVNGERVFSPRRATGKLVPELILDRRDSPLNPSEGYHIQFKPELVSGDALQGGEELIGDSYWRLTFAFSYFWKFFDALTLGQGLRVGQVVPIFDRQTSVPQDERFYMGGVGSVRGFAANTLGPTGSLQQPTGGEFLVNYNAEVRYPIVRNWSLYGATFFDAGLLVDCFDEARHRSSRQCYDNAFPDEAPLSNVRATAGLGLRYLLVDQIPLLFDYGMVLNRRPGERFGSFHFNLGYTF